MHKSELLQGQLIKLPTKPLLSPYNCATYLVTVASLRLLLGLPELRIMRMVAWSDSGLNR